MCWALRVIPWSLWQWILSLGPIWGCLGIKQVYIVPRLGAELHLVL